MNKKLLILTPIPTVVTLSSPDLRAASTTSEKHSEMDTKQDITASNSIGSTTFLPFLPRRNSAFSIYEPLSPKES